MSIHHILDIVFEQNGQNQIIHPVLLQDENDLILVDCGYPNFMSLLESAVHKHHLTLNAITKIIVTHHDMDHMGSLAELIRAYPHIEVIAHQLEKPYIEGTLRSLRLIQAESTLDSLADDVKPHAKQFIQFLQTIEPASVNLTIDSGDKLPWCGGIEVVHTPGHMPGHLSLYLPESKTMICADAVVIEHGSLEIANPQFTLDLDEAVRSVQKLLTYEIEQLICYHGGLFQGDAQSALEKLVRKYI